MKESIIQCDFSQRSKHLQYAESMHISIKKRKTTVMLSLKIILIYSFSDVIMSYLDRSILELRGYDRNLS